MRMSHKKLHKGGFTLIETIITLVVVAIMGSMLFTYFGSKSFTNSANPIQWVQSAQSVHQIMEMITADYQGYPRWKPGKAYSTNSKVTPIKRTGYYYVKTNPNPNPCTSGMIDPSWSLPSSNNPFTSTVTDNTCTWTAYYQTHASSTYIQSLASLRQKIAGNVANSGGEGNTVYYNGNASTGMQYKIIHNRYIDPGAASGNPWDDSVASSAGYLKVTVQGISGNEKLTAVFTE